MVDLSRKLSMIECEQIAYIGNVTDIVRIQYETGTPGNRDFRVILISTLESQGFINPLKLDFLEDVLATPLYRHDLLDILARYKDKHCYKDAIKKMRKKARKQKKRDPAPTTRLTISSEPTRLNHFQEAYQTFLTQFAQMTLSMRAALETGNLTKIQHAFENVVDNGDAVTQTLKSKLSSAGIHRLSHSSGEISGNKDLCTQVTFWLLGGYQSFLLL